MTMNDMMKNLQRMTSLEIAQVTGKMHKDVMKAIRNMEPAWEQERGRKFALTQLRVDIPNGGAGSGAVKDPPPAPPCEGGEGLL